MNEMRGRQGREVTQDYIRSLKLVQIMRMSCAVIPPTTEAIPHQSSVVGF